MSRRRKKKKKQLHSKPVEKSQYSIGNDKRVYKIFIISLIIYISKNILLPDILGYSFFMSLYLLISVMIIFLWREKIINQPITIILKRLLRSYWFFPLFTVLLFVNKYVYVANSKSYPTKTEFLSIENITHTTGRSPQVSFMYNNEYELLKISSKNAYKLANKTEGYNGYSIKIKTRKSFFNTYVVNSFEIIKN